MKLIFACDRRLRCALCDVLLPTLTPGDDIAQAPQTVGGTSACSIGQTGIIACLEIAEQMAIAIGTEQGFLRPGEMY